MKRVIAYLVGKLAVKLHYAKWFDIYSLCSVHEPERYKRTQAKIKIPISLRWEVWRRDHFTCIYCLAWGRELSLDHIVPECYGGKAELSNLVTACTSCNNKKSNKSFKEFIESGWRRKKRRLNRRNLSTTTATLMEKRLSDILQRISTTTGSGN